ncbi:MAG: MmcQ/YjbR family DNA-binding protein [Candidatus Cloacimonetes bacterium]|nr:MmcQ/YjbR family DNA-binding protein [Candidatus Cloacimonadota bacterium]
MDIDAVRLYCLAKPGVTEDFPFDEHTLVMKVGGKMFALLGDEFPPRLNLKCDPLLAENLRAEHRSILPGYHMNKRHWNTLVLNGELPESLIRDLIDHSYELVVNGLPAAIHLLLTGAAQEVECSAGEVK